MALCDDLVTILISATRPAFDTLSIENYQRVTMYVDTLRLDRIVTKTTTGLDTSWLILRRNAGTIIVYNHQLSKSDKDMLNRKINRK